MGRKKKRRFECPVCGTGMTEGDVPISVTPTCNNVKHRTPRLMKEITP